MKMLYEGDSISVEILGPMSFVVYKHNKPLSFIIWSEAIEFLFKEDKSEYIEALEKSRNEESLLPFRNFMEEQYCKFLTQEINNFNNQSKNKGKGFSFVF